MPVYFLVVSFFCVLGNSKIEKFFTVKVQRFFKFDLAESFLFSISDAIMAVSFEEVSANLRACLVSCKGGVDIRNVESKLHFIFFYIINKCPAPHLIIMNFIVLCSTFLMRSY